MGEYHDRDEIGSPAKTDYGTAAWLLGVTVAATLAVCGWNLKRSSSGPTSVTIIGLNGPSGTAPDTTRADNDGALLAATEVVDSR